ncbi:CoA-binding protein [Desulfovibrio ferrophilus]|uniref:CoA-binding protein n=1 Tax=Desulfovibrio ferrophilus TaxID=241368 RepID=A0A2Z6AYL2_9BACT|nr:CoA-binding protein [Desulfovibrio ferrophilus]BBD08308.1 CoA-binding protein [Desulfovibrio ferrophilus]
MLFDDELKALLEKVKTIAILGAKDKPGQAVNTVGQYLINAGYNVIPVHPARTGVWGLPTFKTLADIPHPVDLVDVFRAPQFCPDHAREVTSLMPKPQCFWMQSGITSLEATELLQAQGITVIQDACTMVEHRRLLG